MTFFGTDGIRGVPGKPPLTFENIELAGSAFASFLGKQPKIVVAMDTRESGKVVKLHLVSKMNAAVFDVGVVPTAAAAYLVRQLKADGGIVISASHNPANDNGLKFFNSKGEKITGEDQSKVERLMKKVTPASPTISHVSNQRERYLEFAKSFCTSLKGVKLCVDAANGAAYQVGPAIFKGLGATVFETGISPDGLNINDKVGSEHPGNVKALVRHEKAFAGIALDGDADRLVLVDEHGEILNGDHLLGILALDLNERGLCNAVVATHYSNLGLEDFLKKKGIDLIRTEVGDHHVLEKMRELGLAIGGEQSGHIILHEVGTADGIITALSILRIARKSGLPISKLAKDIVMFPQVTINVPVKSKKPLESLKLSSTAKSYPDLRILIRYSGTQDLLRIMVEGKSEKKINEVSKFLAGEAKKELG